MLGCRESGESRRRRPLPNLLAGVAPVPCRRVPTMRQGTPDGMGKHDGAPAGRNNLGCPRLCSWDKTSRRNPSQSRSSLLSQSPFSSSSSCASPTPLPSLLQEMAAAANRALTEAKIAGSLAGPGGGGRARQVAGGRASAGGSSAGPVLLLLHSGRFSTTSLTIKHHEDAVAPPPPPPAPPQAPWLHRLPRLCFTRSAWSCKWWTRADSLSRLKRMSLLFSPVIRARKPPPNCWPSTSLDSPRI